MKFVSRQWEPVLRQIARPLGGSPPSPGGRKRVAESEIEQATGLMPWLDPLPLLLPLRREIRAISGVFSPNHREQQSSENTEELLHIKVVAPTGINRVLQEFDLDIAGEVAA